MSKSIFLNKIHTISRPYKKNTRKFLSMILLLFLFLPVSILFGWFIFIKLSGNLENYIFGTVTFIIFIVPSIYLAYTLIILTPIYIFIYRIEKVHQILDTIAPKDYDFELLAKNISKISGMVINGQDRKIKTKKGEMIFYTNQYIILVLEELIKELQIRISHQKLILERAKSDLLSLKGSQNEADSILHAQILRLENYLQSFSRLYEIFQKSFEYSVWKK